MVKEAGLASPCDVRLVRQRPKGTSLHALSTRREDWRRADLVAPRRPENRPLVERGQACRFIKSLFIGAARRRALPVWSGLAVLVAEAAEMAAERMAHAGSQRDGGAVRLLLNLRDLRRHHGFIGRPAYHCDRAGPYGERVS